MIWPVLAEKEQASAVGGAGAGTVAAMAALAIVAVGCCILAIAARVGMRGSAQAEGAVRAALAAGDAMERLLAIDRASLVTTGSGTVSQAGGITGEWRATTLPADLLALAVTVRWNDTHSHVLVLRTAVNR